jgi:putative protease
VSSFVPELLAPAGSLDKLKVAISYGADAVYLGGLKFGLRSAAENFTEEELIEGVEFAHENGSKVYVVLNGFLHDKDLDELPSFVEFLDSIKIDAVIVSDLGVIKTVQKHSSIAVHLSTQASCTNTSAAKLWKKMGVERIVVGRETSIIEAGKIKEEAGIEVEMFIHGSMCMAYSGNCTISNFTQGRDSNRGGCAHSCRFEYSIDFDHLDSKEKKTAFFMSSTDLNGIRSLPEFIEHKIDSIKVEGRMKSHLYAGTISKTYSEALRYYKSSGDLLSDDLIKWDNELKKVTHRTYAQANLNNKAGEETIFNEREVAKANDYVLVGRIIDIVTDEAIIIEVRNAFNLNESIEILPFVGEAIEFNAVDIKSLKDDRIERTKPTTLVKIPYIKGVQRNNILRKRLLQ